MKIQCTQYVIKICQGHIFSHVRPLYEQALSDLYRSMHRSLWAQVAHSSFIEGSHTTKNTASGIFLIEALSMCIYRMLDILEPFMCLTLVGVQVRISFTSRCSKLFLFFPLHLFTAYLLFICETSLLYHHLHIHKTIY